MNKTKTIVIGIVGISLAIAIGVSLKSYSQDKETARLQSELFPLMEGTGCRPAFLINSESTLALYCENVEAEREAIRQAALAKVGSWAITSASKDRHHQVGFEDEIVYSSKK